MLTFLICSLNDLNIGRGVICLNVGVNGLLYETSIQLGLGKEAPHRWLVALLCKLVGTIKVVYMHDWHLCAVRREILILYNQYWRSAQSLMLERYFLWVEFHFLWMKQVITATQNSLTKKALPKTAILLKDNNTW